MTDYAVTLLTQMVSEEKRVWAASDLVDRTTLAAPTVAKILKQLAKGGIVTAQRGASGGYRLAQPASDISVAAIVEAIEGPIALTDCAEGSHSCSVEKLCPMSGNWDRINRAIRKALGEVSLAEMASFTHPAFASMAPAETAGELQ